MGGVELFPDLKARISGHQEGLLDLVLYDAHRSQRHPGRRPKPGLSAAYVVIFDQFCASAQANPLIFGEEDHIVVPEIK